MKSILKSSLFMLLALLCSTSVFAQEKRASPAMTAEGTIGEASIVVNYSSPAVKGRTLWGDLVPYDKVWRAGANEATTIEISKDIMIEGEKLAAGKYSLFILPTKENWTVVFNSVPEQWGTYKYDSATDVLRVNVTPSYDNEMNERLKYEMSETGLHFMWGKAAAAVKIQ